MAAPEVPLRGASAQVKLRNPVNTALLSLIPFYALFWWYYINKEMVELGRARGTDQLGDSPGTSVLALFPGGLIIVPALLSYWNTNGRILHDASGCRRPTSNPGQEHFQARMLPAHRPRLPERST